MTPKKFCEKCHVQIFDKRQTQKLNLPLGLWRRKKFFFNWYSSSQTESKWATVFVSGKHFKNHRIYSLARFGTFHRWKLLKGAPLGLALTSSQDTLGIFCRTVKDNKIKINFFRHHKQCSKISYCHFERASLRHGSKAKSLPVKKDNVGCVTWEGWGLTHH